MSKAQETADALRDEADALRDEAKRMICSAIGLPPNISSGSIDRAVDCIIGAAILEAVAVISAGASLVRGNGNEHG